MSLQRKGHKLLSHLPLSNAYAYASLPVSHAHAHTQKIHTKLVAVSSTLIASILMHHISARLSSVGRGHRFQGAPLILGVGVYQLILKTINIQMAINATSPSEYMPFDNFKPIQTSDRESYILNSRPQLAYAQIHSN